MIKAILLLANPVSAWERIVEAKRNVLAILLIFVLPLLLLTSAGEDYGLVHWGKQRGEFGRVVKISSGDAIGYELFNIGLGLAVIFTAAKIIQALGRSFRGHQTYTQAFTLAAYALSPFFTAHLLNVLPILSAWIVWAFAVSLAASALYQGVPRVLLPDPPQTLGLYFMCVLTVVAVTAIAQFASQLLLDQKFENFLHLTRALPK